MLMKPFHPAELVQAFYVSLSAASLPDLQAIQAASLRNNPAMGITGALLFTGGAFAQVLEGPEPSIESMCAAIGADGRHRGLRWLLRRRVAQRSFADWSMKLLEAPGADDLVQLLLQGPSVPVERAERLLTLMFEMPAVAPSRFGAASAQA